MPSVFRIGQLALVCALSGGIVSGQVSADLGEISFPTSGSQQAQPHFHLGVLLLHSFEYDDAREAFRKARELDPDFAMAFWGEALTYNHPLWRSQEKEKAEAVLQLLGPTPEARLARAPTRREKDYLKTLDALYCEGTKVECDQRYASAMAELAGNWPDDLEAASFHALSILGTSQGERNFRTYMRAAAIVEEVFEKNPRHPEAAHYLIHSYDDPIHAPLGLRAAGVYAQIAPQAPHALHMPSHIFMALGQWERSVQSNIASANAAISKGHPQSAYHALWWQHYSLLQQGKYQAAEALLKQMDGLAEEFPSDSVRRHIAYMRSAHVVETQDWDSDLLDDLDISDMRVLARATVLFTRGLQAVHKREPARALTILSQLKALPRPEQRLARDESAVQIMKMGLSAAMFLLLDQKSQVLSSINQAVEADGQRPFEFGPPIPVKPLFELMGEIFLNMRRSKDASDAFTEALRRDPGRSLSLLGVGAAAGVLGDVERQRRAYEQVKENWAEGDDALPLVPSPASPSQVRESGIATPEPMGTIRNFSSLGDQVFFGGQPTDQDLTLLRLRGVATVVNLRGQDEMDALGFDEAEAVSRLGMEYIHLPITSGAILSDDEINRILDVVADSGKQPLILHCASSNRSGYVWAMYRAARDGVEPSEAIRQGEAAGLRSDRLKELALKFIQRNQQDQ